MVSSQIKIEFIVLFSQHLCLYKTNMLIRMYFSVQNRDVLLIKRHFNVAVEVRKDRVRMLSRNPFLCETAGFSVYLPEVKPLSKIIAALDQFRHDYKNDMKIRNYWVLPDGVGDTGDDPYPLCIDFARVQNGIFEIEFYREKNGLEMQNSRFNLQGWQLDALNRIFFPLPCLYYFKHNSWEINHGDPLEDLSPVWPSAFARAKLRHEQKKQ